MREVHYPSAEEFVAANIAVMFVCLCAAVTKLTLRCSCKGHGDKVD